MTGCSKLEPLKLEKQQLKKHIRYIWWYYAFLCKQRKNSLLLSTEKADL